METLDVQAKDFLVKWVTTINNGSLFWQIKPVKRSVNFAIYRKLDSVLSTDEQALGSGTLGDSDPRIAPPAGLFSGVNELQASLDFLSPLTLLHLERQGLTWSRTARRMRLGSSVSVNHITERGGIKTKSRSSTLVRSLANPDMELVENYHKLVPGELVTGLIETSASATYAFVVDNTFSKTTGKTVLFSAKVVCETDLAKTDAPASPSDENGSTLLSQRDPAIALQVEEPEQQMKKVPTHNGKNTKSLNNGDFMQGVLLKKRRKKLQGFTKRFFILNFKLFTLSYFKLNDNKLRGQMPIVEAIVSANERTREIYIDSGMEVWTLKAPSDKDFSVWVEAFNQLKKNSIGIPTDQNLLLVPSLNTEAMQIALRNLQLDFTDVVNNCSTIPRDALESHLYTLHSRLSSILKIKGNDSASVFSEGEFFDANDYMDGIESGVVLVTGLGRKSTSAFSDDEDARLSSDLDSDSDVEKESVIPTQNLREDLRVDKDSEVDLQAVSQAVDLSPLPIEHAVERPCDIPVFTHDPPSFLSFVRKNVGKDLSTLSMPVDMNEPITILQKYAELVEYSEMINNALQVTHPAETGETILRIAAFSVTYLSAFRAKLRVGRKPFNPLLGETYELVREDKGYRFLAEKVNHKPPVFAIRVDSADWVLTFSPAPSQKFWGKTSEIYTGGLVKLLVRSTNETFTWNLPTCVVKNIIAGEKYTEPCSPITVKSSKGQKAVVEFAKAGLFSGRSEDLVIKASDSNKHVLSNTVTGKWTESMVLKAQSAQKKIWTAGSLLPDYETKFGFPEFTGTLNKITAIEKDKLPPTDSRYRPDIAVYANGDIEKAEQLKLQLEEGQRERRNIVEDSGEPYVPRYFKHVGGDPSDPCSGHWEYIEGENSYWERRKTGNWDEKHKLW